MSELSVEAIPRHNSLMGKDLGRNMVPPSFPFTLHHTSCTSSSHALPASPLFNTVSFVMYQTQISTQCPRICCGRRTLPHRCSGCCPILSWINTGASCRLADTEMFVFQGNPPPSLHSSWPLPSQTARALNCYESLWSPGIELLWSAEKCQNVKVARGLM